MQNANNSFHCECIFDSQIAYIVKNINDKHIETISILDYLKNIKLQNEIAAKLKFLVCNNNNELIKYESDIRKSHFKHKNNECHCQSCMSIWHKNWQNCFENTEVQIGNRRADAVVGDYVLEFQHSKITKELINVRSQHYLNNKKELLWIIDCGDNTLNIKKLEKDRYMLEFKKDYWKYENFTDCEYIYIDVDNKIFRIMPSRVKSHMIDVIEYKHTKEFINSIKEDKFDWIDDELAQCILYHNQLGAGCGKTYESIQLLEKDDRFKNKETWIYLTKMHSAKDVIYNELKEQYTKGKLSKLKIPKEGINDGGKQYKISYLNNDTKRNCKIIIGTIDSFIFAIGNNSIRGNDYFGKIVRSIIDGYQNIDKSGIIKYAQNSIKLNKNCLIIIDEAQDLGPEYIEALSIIMRNTYIDVYVIGDKLQSILHEHNIHTFLEKNDLPTIIVKRNSGINNVRRFHNVKLKDFVNNTIDFNKYNLPSIEKICDDGNCKYEHENNIDPYNIFQVPSIYQDDHDDEKCKKVIEKIIDMMEMEIGKYNYLPHNFMFIIPCVAKSFLAKLLESRLQTFWVTKFSDAQYQKNVLSINEYWKTNYDNQLYHKYVYLHKSEENKPINLIESENATRILSIHASKGNGCEVVFLLELSEYVLTLLSKQKCNLVYDSFLHVAITRQKKAIYIGLYNMTDDIAKRFKISGYKIEKDLEIKPKLYITTYVRYTSLIDYCVGDNDIFNKIDETYIKPNEYEKLLCDKNNDLIDWGHHIIRNYVFFYNFLVCIINNEVIDKDMHFKPDQLIAKLHEISKLNIKIYVYKDYYKKLSELSNKNKKEKTYTEIPLLYFDSADKSKYSKYKEMLVNLIKNIQYKIQNAPKNKKIPILCPLETIITFHIIEILQNYKYAEIQIMDIYSILYCFDECYSSSNCEHNINDCLCNKLFSSQNINNNNISKYEEFRKNIVNHYKKLEQIEKLYNNYKIYISTKFKDATHFTYNLYHYFSFEGLNNNFNIYDRFRLIAHSNEYVINFIIKPQFNKVNFNKIIFNGLYANYLIINPNSKTKNFERYDNKKVMTCILTLDSIEPIFYEFNINKNDIIIRQTFSIYLLKKYSEYHDIIFDYYNYCKKTKPPEKNSIIYTYEKLQEHDKLPTYIANYFYDINKELDKSKTDKDNILLKVNDKTIFLSELQKYLEQYINSFVTNSNCVDIIDNDY